MHTRARLAASCTTAAIFIDFFNLSFFRCRCPSLALARSLARSLALACSSRGGSTAFAVAVADVPPGLCCISFATAPGGWAAPGAKRTCAQSGMMRVIMESRRTVMSTQEFGSERMNNDDKSFYGLSSIHRRSHRKRGSRPRRPALAPGPPPPCPAPCHVLLRLYAYTIITRILTKASFLCRLRPVVFALQLLH